MAEPQARPAYYAAGPGRWRDWWTLLHPPFTAWHLSYVVLGAMIAHHVRLDRLVAALAAFFLAVGLAAHALDELHGRPLRTAIPSSVLVAVTAVGLAGAVALGAIGITRVGWVLLPFMIVGPLLVVGYNAELFGGIIHTDLGFAAAWSLPRADRLRRRSGPAGGGPRADGRRRDGDVGWPAAPEHSGQAAQAPNRRGVRKHHAEQR